MVTLALVLFTVSTLASLTNAFPQEQPVVRHECGDKTFCHIKPAGYPQEEIDRLALKHLCRRITIGKRFTIHDVVGKYCCACVTTINIVRECQRQVKPQLRRMRRQIPKAADPEYGGNCFPKTKNTPVFTMRDEDGPKYLINSEWFVQNITEVECEEQELNSSCFKEYLISNDIQTKCETRKITVQLLTYIPGSEGLKPVTTPIGTDCACVIKK